MRKFIEHSLRRVSYAMWEELRGEGAVVSPTTSSCAHELVVGDTTALRKGEDDHSGAWKMRKTFLRKTFLQNDFIKTFHPHLQECHAYVHISRRRTFFMYVFPRNGPRHLFLPFKNSSLPPTTCRCVLCSSTKNSNSSTNAYLLKTPYPQRLAEEGFRPHTQGAPHKRHTHHGHLEIFGGGPRVGPIRAREGLRRARAVNRDGRAQTPEIPNR